jgi:hypothetical protein
MKECLNYHKEKKDKGENIFDKKMLMNLTNNIWYMIWY